jgi:CRP/FNR family transcriptional regulator
MLSDAKQHRQHPQGQCIIQEGENNSGVFFIQSGVVKLQITGEKGRPLILRLCGTGDHFGHHTTDEHPRSPYSVVAVEDTNLCFVTQADYARLNGRYPDFQKEIIRSYINELQFVQDRLLQLAYKSVRQKVADTLLKIADVYHYCENEAGIHVHLDRQEMADMAGTTKEQVSKVLLDLKQEGVIHFRAKHFTSINLNSLSRIAEN